MVAQYSFFKIMNQLSNKQVVLAEFWSFELYVCLVLSEAMTSYHLT